MGKKSGSGSGMNNPDHISKRLETIFWVKILKFFNADSGWKKFRSGIKKSRIRDNHPGYATLSSLNYFTGYETIKNYIQLNLPEPAVWDKHQRDFATDVIASKKGLGSLSS